jgi:beta-lactamase superfamily II metal-dependent hydrolase
LNVRLGACSIIRHGSDRVSVFDVNSAFAPEETKAAHFSLAENYQRKSWEPVPGNFQQKEDPDNPIVYLRKIGVSSIFRFILTHPDMDHMGGIKALFTEFSPLNLWDTATRRRSKKALSLLGGSSARTGGSTKTSETRVRPPIPGVLFTTRGTATSSTTRTG